MMKKNIYKLINTLSIFGYIFVVANIWIDQSFLICIWENIGEGYRITQ